MLKQVRKKRLRKIFLFDKKYKLIHVNYLITFFVIFPHDRQNEPFIKKTVAPARSTGIIIKMNNAAEPADAIKQLIDNPEVRNKLGEAGRKHVKSNYELEFCVKQMTNIYERILNKSFQNERRLKILKVLFSQF
jgi:hypothetical protein